MCNASLIGSLPKFSPQNSHSKMYVFPIHDDDFSKKHGGIGKKTPAELAGILVDGNNKWKTIIQNASLNQYQ